MSSRKPNWAAKCTTVNAGGPAMYIVAMSFHGVTTEANMNSRTVHAHCTSRWLALESARISLMHISMWPCLECSNGGNVRDEERGQRNGRGQGDGAEKHSLLPWSNPPCSPM
jgi:hypothetical protein